MAAYAAEHEIEAVLAAAREWRDTEHAVQINEAFAEIRRCPKPGTSPRGTRLKKRSRNAEGGE